MQESKHEKPLERSLSRSALKSPRYLTTKASMPSLINSTGIDLMQTTEDEQNINEYLRAELEAVRDKKTGMEETIIEQDQAL